MMKVFMIVATHDNLSCRVFIGCEDFAHEFASFLQVQGWSVRIEAEVDPRTQPRIREEEEVANALVQAYHEWKTQSTL